MKKQAETKSEDGDIIEILQSLIKHMDVRFDRVDQQFETTLHRLDEIQYTVSGHEQRLSILEDRLRMVATKIGLDFHSAI